MRTRVVCVSAFFPMMIYCVSPDAWAQGSLTPPGAPGETMKTLMQVEPRTPIASLPHTVSQPGSYYLTTNLASSGHGVVITSDSVTLDLMGFTLMGDNSILSQGVFIDGGTAAPIRDVVVRNGIVRGFSDGVRAEYTQGSRFEHLVVSSNVFNGRYHPDSSSTETGEPHAQHHDSPESRNRPPGPQGG